NTMMYSLVVILAWGFFVLYWFAASFSAKRTAVRGWRQGGWIRLVIFIALFLILFESPGIADIVLPQAARAVGTVLCLFGHRLRHMGARASWQELGYAYVFAGRPCARDLRAVPLGASPYLYGRHRRNVRLRAREPYLERYFRAFHGLFCIQRHAGGENDGPAVRGNVPCVP